MTDKFSLEEPPHGYSNNTILAIDASISNMYTLYEPALLEGKLVDELRRIAFENAIRTRAFNRAEGLGGVGSSILVWIQEFYQNHSIYFAILAKVPGLLQFAKLLITKSIDAFYWIRNKKHNILKAEFDSPSLVVTLAWNLANSSTDMYTNNRALKSAYLESLFVVRQFERKINELFPSLEFTFLMKYKNTNTGMRLSVGGFRTGKAMEALILGKLKRFNKEDKSFWITVTKSRILGLKRVKYERNFVDIVDGVPGFD